MLNTVYSVVPDDASCMICMTGGCEAVFHNMRRRHSLLLLLVVRVLWAVGQQAAVWVEAGWLVAWSGEDLQQEGELQPAQGAQQPQQHRHGQTSDGYEVTPLRVLARHSVISAWAMLEAASKQP